VETDTFVLITSD